MQVFLAIVNLIPGLIKIIAAVEEAFPQTGIGESKLQLVKNILTHSYSTINDMWGPLEQIINMIVAFANNVGAFNTTKK
jgi:hypothetical protein